MSSNIVETYKSFEGKRPFFNHIIIKDIDALKCKLKEYEPEIIWQLPSGEIIEKRNVFRGVSDASYKMYSSLQRCCCEWNKSGHPISMPDLLKEIMKRFNSNKKLVEAFNKEKAPFSYGSELAKWAFIQHFGGPSPLVDFTPNKNNALFFALQNQDLTEIIDQNESNLKNYISLYICPYVSPSVNDIYEKGSKSGCEFKDKCIKNHPEYIIDTEKSNEQLHELFLAPALWGFWVLGKRVSKHKDLKDGSQYMICPNNSHITKQDGDFLVGNIQDIRPLEQSPRFKKKQFKENGESSTEPSVACLDIHKSLIPKIKEEFPIPTQKEMYTSDDYLPEIKRLLKDLWEPDISYYE